MDEAKLHEVRQWLTKAHHDLRSSERLLTDDPPLLDTAVYHCQQAAEKALKAYLTLQEVQFLRTHILGVLLEQCMVTDQDFEQLRDIADALTPFAIAFRYPGDALEPSPDDAEEAFRFSGEVVRFVVNKMPPEVTQSNV